MIKDCQEIFEKLYKEKGDALLTDSFTPKEGEYFIVDISKENPEIVDKFSISKGKNKKELVYSKQSRKSLAQKLDYYSLLLEMNKPIDPNKCIHSNNYLSFIVKKNSIKEGKLKNETIEKYYQILRNPREKYTNKQTLELYNGLESDIGIPNKKLIDKIEKWVKENVFELELIFEQNDYLKIFFVYANEEDTLENYRLEYKRYVFPNIYNNNLFNKNLEGHLFGLPNDNMGMNQKKPYLGNKSRGSIEVPYLIQQSEALLQRKFFDYLMNAASNGMCDIYFNVEQDAIEKVVLCKDGELPSRGFSGYYLRIQKGKNEAEIQDFQNIPSFTPEILKGFLYRRYLDEYENDKEQGDDVGKNKIRVKGKVLKYEKGEKDPVYSVQELQNIINKVFFEYLLTGNYYTKAEDLSITDNSLKTNLLAYRYFIWKWIRTGAKVSDNAAETFKELGEKALLSSLTKGEVWKARKQFNLKQSLKLYFEKNTERDDEMLKIGERLLEKIKGKESWDIKSDEEYFYAVGQIVQYLFSLSNAGKKPISKINNFIKAKNKDKIKDLLRKDFLKYNHAIESRHRIFKCLYSSVVAYEPEGNVLSDFIIQGFLDESVLYIGGKNENEEE